MALVPMNFDELTYVDMPVTFSQLTWNQSASGKYYAATSFDATGKTVLAISIMSWSSVAGQVIVQPYINGSGGVSLMSNTTSWGSSTPSMTLRIFYK